MKQLRLSLQARFSHGGRRPGAGRPNRSGLQAHVRRERFTAREPLHVTLRLRDGLPNLRRRDVFRALRAAVAQALGLGLAIVHYAVLSNHLHLIVEARDRGALGRQMQSFGISFAKRLNAILGRKGPVFSERYHVHVLRTPTEVANAVRYVVTNEARHRGRRVTPNIYSSAGLLSTRDRAQGLWVSEPRTWLLSTGWRRSRLTS